MPDLLATANRTVCTPKPSVEIRRSISGARRLWSASGLTGAHPRKGRVWRWACSGYSDWSTIDHLLHCSLDRLATWRVRRDQRPVLEFREIVREGDVCPVSRRGDFGETAAGRAFTVPGRPTDDSVLR